MFILQVERFIRGIDLTATDTNLTDINVEDGVDLTVNHGDITDGTRITSVRKRRNLSGLQLITAQFRTTYVVDTDGYDETADEVLVDVQRRVGTGIENIGSNDEYDPTNINLVAKPKQDQLYTRCVYFRPKYLSQRTLNAVFFKYFQI